MAFLLENDHLELLSYDDMLEIWSEETVSLSVFFSFSLAPSIN